MTDSASSSYSFSSSPAYLEYRFPAASPNCSRTLLSCSSSLMAYHLFSPSGTPAGSSDSICSTLDSTQLSKMGRSSGSCAFFAAPTASSTTSLRPVFLRADVSTIGQPSFFDNASTSILMSFFLIRSAILRASTTGIPVSRSCVVRYRFLSILVASTRSIITSGFSFKIKSLETTSSSVYGERE